MGYPLAIAEKDYFLAIVSKIIYDSSLRDKLVFKGGTALHHCYLNQMRFSEDLDFTSLDRNIKLEDVKKIFEPYDFLEIKKDYVSNATIKLERLTYSGPLGQPNSLKLEIDFIQNVSKYWVNGSVDVKKKIQRLVFPSGFYINPYSRQYLTPEVNQLFHVTSELSRVSEDVKKNSPLK